MPAITNEMIHAVLNKTGIFVERLDANKDVQLSK